MTGDATIDGVRLHTGGKPGAEKKTRGRGKDVRDRLAHAEGMVLKHHASATAHHLRWHRLRSRGEPAKAQKAESLYNRAEKLRRDWVAEVEKLRPLARQADAADRIAERISAQPRHHTRGALAGLNKAERKAERETRRRYAGAGLAYDGRTAAGGREFDIEALGATSRARTAPYRSLFLRRADATEERIATAERFDDLCHSANKGLYPLPKFDVGTSGGLPLDGVPGDVVAREQMTRLAQYLGEDAFALLWVRIIVRVSWVDLERKGAGSPQRLSDHFLAALDDAARFFSRPARQTGLGATLASLFGPSL